METITAWRGVLPELSRWNAIARWRAEREAVGPSVERGGMLAFRPLLLHASSAALV
jgi:hypothetical protein